MKKETVTLILLGILLIGGVFYWYQFRPSQIRKTCNDRAKQSAIKLLQDKVKYSVYSSTDEKTAAEQGHYYVSDYENSYESCLHSEGLK